MHEVGFSYGEEYLVEEQDRKLRTLEKKLAAHSKPLPSPDEFGFDDDDEVWNVFYAVVDEGIAMVQHVARVLEGKKHSRGLSHGPDNVKRALRLMEEKPEYSELLQIYIMELQEQNELIDLANDAGMRKRKRKWRIGKAP